MAPRLLELAERRGALRARIAAQREELALRMRPLAHALGVADAVREGVREGVAQARRHPEWLAATAAAIFIVRPRRAWRWARRGLLLWSGIDFLRQPRPESAPAPAGRLARWLRLFLR